MWVLAAVEGRALIPGPQPSQKARPAGRKSPVQTQGLPQAKFVTDALRLARILQARGIRKTAFHANRAATLHRRTHITEMEE
ncbi:hypothetical protein ANACOL_02644 [Anaerotruncus colihominis DSM 17241]|uniref:Uncharacterized protein n=1 Tax=Anaerotruncus colihominis DSM 17241 TaxID=445972 RepID=B0PCY1_9FIRM|nr:hypothetical protein ANACOL_02644 [Anaerotruncus colihominis DSM 17241]